MKFILVILALVIGFQGFSKANYKMPEYPDTWRIIKKEKDITLDKGIVEVKFVLKQLFSKKPIENVEITFNSSYKMGVTDPNGLLTVLVKSSRYKMCADTPQGNGITKYLVLENQTSYVFEINMRLKKEIKPVYGKNDIQPKKTRNLFVS